MRFVIWARLTKEISKTLENLGFHLYLHRDFYSLFTNWPQVIYFTPILVYYSPSLPSSISILEQGLQIKNTNLLKENFDVDIHNPHVKKVVNKFLAQRLREHRCRLHKYYKNLGDSIDKRQSPPKNLSQEDWNTLCSTFETEEFKVKAVSLTTRSVSLLLGMAAC
ncbi:hypothetical protein ACHQM5_022121 [Ranunculus cassubicifolius]